eukprot:359545-Prorocentrum_lima.AAC.1
MVQEGRLHVVDRYKHLGFVIHAAGLISADAQHKVANAMSAYAPLAFPVLGNPQIRLEVRESFTDSL